MGKVEKVSVEVESELVAAAEAAGLDLSKELTRALRRLFPPVNPQDRKRAAEEWYKENKEAVDWYNRHVEEHGLFSDGIRMF